MLFSSNKKHINHRKNIQMILILYPNTLQEIHFIKFKTYTYKHLMHFFMLVQIKLLVTQEDFFSSKFLFFTVRGLRVQIFCCCSKVYCKHCKNEKQCNHQIYFFCKLPAPNVQIPKWVQIKPMVFLFLERAKKSIENRILVGSYEKCVPSVDFKKLENRQTIFQKRRQQKTFWAG